MKLSLSGRALHYVFKVADRTLTSKFYREVLGMKVLRHEEFKEGCEAQCNGPYDNRWSKTMVGYGPEDNHFVVELTYNYNVSSYDLGNDFLGFIIKSSEAISNVKSIGWPFEQEEDKVVIQAPGGYKFYLIDEPQPTDTDPVLCVTLASSNLDMTIGYWNSILGLDIFEKTSTSVAFGFDKKGTKLQFKYIGTAVDHKTAYGRIAFSVPTDQLKTIDEAIKKNNLKILTPLVSLDTPGKATVTVIILADPDDHEICFVGDESFRELSAFDPAAEAELDKYIKKDEERKIKN